MQSPQQNMMTRPWQLSLRQKLSFWSFVPTVSILVVALLAYGGYQQATADLAIERNRDVTRLVAEQLAAELDESVHVLDVLTRDAAMQSGELHRQIECLQQAKGRLTPFDAGIMILSDKGRVVAGLPFPSSWQGRDMSRATWYDSRLPRFSNIVIESPSGKTGIIVTVPIYSAQDECIGLLAGLFNIPPATSSTLYGGLKRGMGLRGVPAEDILYVDDKGQLHPAVEVSAMARLFQHTRDVSSDRDGDSYYIIDGAGRAIYHPQRWMIGQDTSADAIVSQALRGRVGAVRIRNARGERVVASYAPIQGTSWMLISEEPWDALMAYSLESRSLILLLLAIGVFLPAIVVTLAMRRITDPLKQMIGAAQAVASGKFGHTIQANTGDELQDLAEQFNTMSTQLEASYAELEQRVADRTRELETLTTVAVETSQLLDLSAVLQVALEQTLSALSLEAGEAFCTGPDGDSPQVLATIGFANPLLANTTREPICDAQGLRNKIRRSDIGTLKMSKALRQALEENYHQIIRVPIIAKTECIGALNLAAQNPQVYDPEALSMLSSIGHHVGVAAENVRLHIKAQQLAVVEERNRLARELHDSVTQSLYAITFYAEAAARLVHRAEYHLASSHMDDLGQTAQAALQEMRLLVFDLRPPILEEEGLIGALQARLDAVEGRAGVCTHLVVSGETPHNTHHDQALYRIAQEALNNALRHAEARHITVTVDYGADRLGVEVCDDGVGFEKDQPAPEGQLGLRGMRERAQQMGALLHIESCPGEGTKIHVEVGYEQ